MTMILKISFEGGETKRITKGKVTELYDELTNYMINGFNYYEFTGNNGEKTIINLKKITDVKLEHNDNLKYGFDMRSHNREKLMKKAASYTLPGHGPDVEKMTDEELENYVNMIEKMFEMAFGEEETEDDEL